jgi:hypothetical protein
MEEGTRKIEKYRHKCIEKGGRNLLLIYILLQAQGEVNSEE